MKISYLIFCLVILLGSTSCSKDDDTTPEQPTEANILGSVNLYNEGITTVDNSNMTIKVEGTEINATTDIDGNFVLTNVPYGTYTLVFEKVGYGSFMISSLEHNNIGSSTVITETPSLGELSTTQITNLSVDVNEDGVTFSVTTDPAGSNGNTRYIRYFLSTDSDVSNDNYTYFSPGLVSQINPKELTLSSNDLLNAGFSTGETVYAKVYGDSYWSNEYDAPSLCRKVFPNLNMTSTGSVSFVVP